AKNIITAATYHNVSKIVFTSTVAIYGLDKDNPDENCPPDPFNDYGKSKLLAEALFLDWASQDEDRSLIIFRPAVVFGENNRGNVFNLISQIKSRRFIMVGSGQNRKSMGYVGNLALILALQLNNSGVKIYNYCDKPDLTSKEIATVISEKLGAKLPKFFVPIWAGDIAGIFFDFVAKISGRKLPVSRIRIRKFSAETTINTARLVSDGYSGRYTTEEGLSRMIDSDFLN
ncbi:MAG: NAD-dependent epimerase/dehydratase family protein, partial [Pseudohongiella sp.]|nr:NAD-dependent epimerase/dehydratase family protein [Pseudohongiella sp.]